MSTTADTGLQTRRDHKLHGDSGGDNRSKSQRDHDRILYSTAFRRLGAVTQVVLARDDGHFFHNRLTHSLKVAQIGRRIAEKFVAKCEADKNLRASVNARGGIDPEVVEAACLAHDLGHPPFGHLAEKELHRLATADGVDDGFEGNAQTFRILARLSLTRPGVEGLNLTVATLNAVSKYPWPWRDRKPGDKWGTYDSEQEILIDVRNRLIGGGVELDARQRTIEAEIMDWADDITYAVHDLEDFLRAGFIPLYRLAHDTVEAQLAQADAEADWWTETMGSPPTARTWLDATSILFGLPGVPLNKPFGGTAAERARIRAYMSALVHRFVDDTKLDVAGLHRTRETIAAVALLKALTKRYVHMSPLLATQQHGQRRIIGDLYEAYMNALDTKETEIFPSRLVDDATNLVKRAAPVDARVRLVIDCIASMTEARAASVHHRLLGIETGELIDPLA